MGRFYRANEELKNHLLEEGLTFHDRENPEVSYFTEHTSGRQIKVDTKNNLVTLLNNIGEPEDYSSSFTDNQISSFLNK